MPNTPSFNLQHILLLESSFTRDWNLDLDKEEFINRVDIDVDDSRSEDSLMVTVTLKFTAGMGDDDQQIFSMIKMVGVFSTHNSGPLSVDQFASVNAPAIIFPFIREHLSSLSVKAGINPILLSPVNFVQHSENKKKKVNK